MQRISGWVLHRLFSTQHLSCLCRKCMQGCASDSGFPITLALRACCQPCQVPCTDHAPLRCEHYSCLVATQHMMCRVMMTAVTCWLCLASGNGYQQGGLCASICGASLYAHMYHHQERHCLFVGPSMVAKQGSSCPRRSCGCVWQLGFALEVRAGVFHAVFAPLQQLG